MDALFLAASYGVLSVRVRTSCVEHGFRFPTLPVWPTNRVPGVGVGAQGFLPSLRIIRGLPCRVLQAQRPQLFMQSSAPLVPSLRSRESVSRDPVREIPPDTERQTDSRDDDH